MIASAPQEARWVRAEPRRILAGAVVERIVQRAFPGSRVLSIQPFAGGMRNANFRLELNRSPSPVVLRMYEHDASLCQKEVDLIRLVGASAPVAEVLYAEPRGWEDAQPFALFRFVEGISFRELQRSGERESIEQGAFAIGETLAALGQFKFGRTGWLGPGPSVTSPLLDGGDPIPRFVDLCLASSNLQRRAPAPH